jgi:ribosomal-protein-alanine N-acetyltransferase
MLGHKGTREIITDRLILRQFNENDALDMFHNWANDNQVTRYLSWPTHKDIEVSKRVIGSWIESYANDETYQWAIALKESNMVIGAISVITISDSHMNCEIGYCIGKDFWGQGIVTEALKGVISFLFYEVGFERIAAFHHSENIASGKVMKKAGMKYEGRMRHFHKNSSGAFVDCDLYSILKEEAGRGDQL